MNNGIWEHVIFKGYSIDTVEGEWKARVQVNRGILIKHEFQGRYAGTGLLGTSFNEGDKVCSLIKQGQLTVGAHGTVKGPATTGHKTQLHVSFKDGAGQWNMYPSALSREGHTGRCEYRVVEVDLDRISQNIIEVEFNKRHHGLGLTITKMEGLDVVAEMDLDNARTRLVKDAGVEPGFRVLDWIEVGDDTFAPRRYKKYDDYHKEAKGSIVIRFAPHPQAPNNISSGDL